MSQFTTKSFRTKTEFTKRKNAKVKGKWHIALDIGYSSVKTFSPNSISIFPSYARKVSSSFSFITTPPAEAILYRDDVTSQMWIVGEVAQNMIEAGDTNDSENILYSRDRYYDEMFLVIARCGMGLGLIANEHGKPDNDEIFLQTGLPEMYLEDESVLKEALSGDHKFSLKIGAGPWTNYEVKLPESHIFVMSQPRGTLYSVCVNDDGKPTADAEELLNKNMIVFDGGFGTLDLFYMRNGSHDDGVKNNGETYSDLGMKRVLQVASQMIYEQFKVSIPVPSMQKYLEEGVVRYFDKRKLEAKDYSIDEVIENASSKVCKEAIARLTAGVDFGNFRAMIITGGTGEAWFDQMNDRLKAAGVTIIPGNRNDGLPFVYSNVRGYYLYRYNKLMGDK